MYDNTEIKEAALALTRSDAAPQLHKYLLGAIAASGALPMKLTGDAAVMNPLLWLAQDNFKKYTLLMDQVDRIRAKAELPPLQKQGFQNKPYMRDFMAAGRLRRGRASDLENKDRPARDKLRGAPRLEFERIVQAQWKKQLDGHLDRARQQTPTGRITKEALTGITNRFWAGVDTALDEKEAESRRRV